MKKIKYLLLVAFAAVAVSATLPVKENEMARTRKTTTTVETLKTMPLADWLAEDYQQPTCGENEYPLIIVSAAFAQAHQGEIGSCGYSLYFLQICSGPYAGQWACDWEAPLLCPIPFESESISAPTCIPISEILC